jgi:hypothetical protein
VSITNPLVLTEILSRDTLISCWILLTGLIPEKKIWLILAFCIGLVLSPSEPLFIAFGDFGFRSKTFEQVVSGIKAHARPRFVTLLRDLFYIKGVQSVSDSQFGLFHSFSSIIDTFYVAVGSHDYGYAESVRAILEYAHVNPKWVFYFSVLCEANHFEARSRPVPHRSRIVHL